MSTPKEQYEKLKKLFDEDPDIDLFEAFQKIKLKSDCCGADLEQDKWGSIFCKKCKRVIVGVLNSKTKKSLFGDK